MELLIMKSSSSLIPSALDSSFNQPTWLERVVIRYLASVLKDCQGSLQLVLPSKHRHQFRSGKITGKNNPQEPDATVVLHTMRPLLRLLFSGANGWSDAYINNEWDSPRLLNVIKWALVNEIILKRATRFHHLTSLSHKRLHRANANTKKGSQRNISAHYDLGNDFFKEWLDPGMTYSAALFKGKKFTDKRFKNTKYSDSKQILAEAQKEKYRRILELLNPRESDHIVEIGCGWGEFASQAAKKNNIKIDGVTLSEQQLLWGQEKLAHEKLSEKATLQLMDYRDISRQYDGVVSIEMFEAVGEENWDTYFKKLHGILKPGGKAVLQIITIDDERFHSYRKNPDFIQRYIFPGGMLPSSEVLKQKFSQHGFSLDYQQMFGMDYAKTLSIWWENFESQWPTIAEQGFDNRFYRLWRYYLAYCQGGFEQSKIDVGLFVIKKY